MMNHVMCALIWVAGAVLVSDGVRAEEKVELKPKLPKPMFVGTPKTIKTPNLEKALGGKKRPPVMIPKGCVNVAFEKEVTSSDDEPIVGSPDWFTDGDKEGTDGSYIELGPGKQWMQIDLEKDYVIHAVALWHYHQEARVYHDVVIQTAADPDFIMDVKTVYNNDHDNSSGLGVGKDKEYIETYQGRLIPVEGVKARYIRFYSNGSTAEMNHYIEAEVYAVPAK